jgi:hypothetical protein
MLKLSPAKRVGNLRVYLRARDTLLDDASRVLLPDWEQGVVADSHD